MATLAPFAQVVADVGELRLVGSRRGRVCVHGGNLPCEFPAFHYLGRNRIALLRGSSSQAQRRRVGVDAPIDLRPACIGLRRSKDALAA
jgi:hypothetical protein